MVLNCFTFPIANNAPCAHFTKCWKIETLPEIKNKKGADWKSGLSSIQIDFEYGSSKRAQKMGMNQLNWGEDFQSFLKNSIAIVFFRFLNAETSPKGPFWTLILVKNDTSHYIEDPMYIELTNSKFFYFTNRISDVVEFFVDGQPTFFPQIAETSNSSTSSPPDDPPPPKTEKSFGMHFRYLYFAFVSLLIRLTNP